MLQHIKITGILAAAITVASSSALAGTIDFETPPLGALTHQADYNATSGFSSGGAFFNNSYTSFGGGFFSWSGFSLSRETDTTTAGFTNQFSAASGSGSGGSSQYAVGFGDASSTVPKITFAPGERPVSLQIVNTTYAALSMRDGDAFAKKFGGVSGNDPDFFKLTINGLDGADQPTGSLDFYLADFRFANNAQDYIVTAWTPVDLNTIGASTQALTFGFTSSDNGGSGINTPAYFAVDNINTVPEPSSALLLATGLLAFARRRR